MTGKRKQQELFDPSIGSVAVVLVAAAAFATAMLTWLPPREVTTPKPIDVCRDGIVQQSDGEKWYPVTLPRKSHYYDGKKYQPDHPAGHVRTIPCGEQK